MPRKIDTFGYFTTCDGEEDSSPAIVTSLLVVFEGEHSLFIVFGLDENEFVFENALKYAHLVPLDDDVLHVLVGREEAYHAVRHDLAKLNQQAAIVTNNSRVLPLLKLGAYSELIRALRHDQWLNGVPSQVDLKVFHNFRLKVQHFCVPVHWRYRARCEDNIPKLLEDGCRCQTSIHAVELEQGVEEQVVLGVGLNNHDEALVVGGN